MPGTNMLLALLTLSLVLGSESAKILLLPAGINSHVHFMANLGVGLATEGHEITLVIASDVQEPEIARNSKMDVVIFSVDRKHPIYNSFAYWDLVHRAAGSNLVERTLRSAEIAKMANAAQARECQQMFGDQSLMMKISKTGYDFVVMDRVGCSCFYMIPNVLKIPFAIFTLPSYQGSMFRVPALPSFVPSLYLDFTDQMSFTQRLMTLLHELWCSFNSFYKVKVGNLQNETSSWHSTIGHQQVLQKADLMFYIDDVIVGYSRPLMPNTIPLGDILGRPGKHLPDDIERFLLGSLDGVVFVSLGSYYDHISPVIVVKFCKAFRNISQRVVWKLNNASLCMIPDKVLTGAWLPQNDILAHQNVKLFITHAGMSSILQTIHHGKPVISVPFYSDQPHNAKFMEKSGFGESISFSDFTAEELINKIHRVLNNSTIFENIQRGSALIKSKPETPAKRASFWIEHVIQYGSKHLKSSASDLNLWQFYMFDLFLFIVVVCFIVPLVLILLLFVCFHGFVKHTCAGRKIKLA